MFTFFIKSIFHNIGVLFVGFILAVIGSFLDSLFGINHFQSVLFGAIGLVLLAIGFAIRVWATFYFYKNQMKVISLKPQKKLLTTGPFRFSRNPLYLGGNIFIFFGASILLGSPSAVMLTILGIPLTDFMIRREEKQLEKTFGEEWIAYKKKVRRWL